MLKTPRHKGHPHEYRHIRILVAYVHELPDPGCYRAALGDVIAVFGIKNFTIITPVGRKFQDLPFPHHIGFCYDFICHIKNRLRRTVVLFKFFLGSTEVLRKVQDVEWMRSSPCVDALLRIPDHTDVASLADEEVDEEVLDLVCVLVFVNKDIIKPFLPIPSDVRFLRKEIDCEINNIVVVECIALFHLDEILRSHWSKAGHRIGKAAYIIDNVATVILLRLGDDPLSRVSVLDIHAALSQDILNHFYTVMLIVNGEVLVVFSLKGGDIFSQNPHAERVECRYPFRLYRKKALYSLLHFSGGLFGKGDGEYPVRPDALLFD